VHDPRAHLFSTLLSLVAVSCVRPPEAEKASTDTTHYTVPALPPDSIPMAVWKEIHDPRNMEPSAPEWAAPFARNLILLTFREDASQAQRQQAVDAVGGVVIGGTPAGRGGFYYVRIKDDGTSRPLFRATAQLRAMPQVDLASPDLPSFKLGDLRRSR